MAVTFGIGAHVGVVTDPKQQRVGRPGVFHATFLESPGDTSDELLVQPQDILAPAGAGASHAVDVTVGVVVVEDVLGGQRPEAANDVGIESGEAMVEALKLLIASDQLADALFSFHAERGDPAQVVEP